MHITKRDGSSQLLSPQKLSDFVTRLQMLQPSLPFVNPETVIQLVIAGAYEGATTEMIGELIATKAASLGFSHPQYLLLAGRTRIITSRKNVPSRFSDAMHLLYRATDTTGVRSPLVSESLMLFVEKNRTELDAHVSKTRARELMLTYFSVMTLERSYLLRTADDILHESPCYMWMRVAIGVSARNDKPCMENTKEIYDMLSELKFTCATPTLFNAGTPTPQCSSCFLLPLKNDSISGIFETLKTCAQISKHAGGIGLSCTNVRATGSYIRGTGGKSNGLVPMLRVFNNTARYVDQGGNKRKGSFAFYLEPWHPDIFEFLDIRKNQGVDDLRCRDLFTGMWIPDLFMKRVVEDSNWSLICPDTAPDLVNLYGDEFDKRYSSMEGTSCVRKVVKARDIWTAIINSQIETGTPYLCYKRAANEKSNQKNLGTIRSSNLCAEIMQYSSSQETAVCNLASIVLVRFCDRKEFDFDGLARAVSPIIRMLDRVIDLNFYPHPSAKLSNHTHRPVGLGIQGLSDVFMKLGIPFASDAAVLLGAHIMETIYYAAVGESVALAKKLGRHASFIGSPASRGILQFDLWNKTTHVYKHGRIGETKWAARKNDVKEFGLRNSLLIAIMPTASTSQICGSLCESIEPLRASIFTRRTNAGEFVVVNSYLVNDLQKAGLWNDETRNMLARDRGSAQRLPGITELQKAVYLTTWEFSQKWLIDHACARGPFVCQSQSLNLYANAEMLQAGSQKCTAMHFYAWRQGLKTGMYYLRSNPEDPTLQFTVDKSAECLSCGS